MPGSCNKEGCLAQGPYPGEQRGQGNYSQAIPGPPDFPQMSWQHIILIISLVPQRGRGWWKMDGGIVISGFESWLCYLLAFQLMVLSVPIGRMGTLAFSVGVHLLI